MGTPDMADKRLELDRRDPELRSAGQKMKAGLILLFGVPLGLCGIAVGAFLLFILLKMIAG